LWKPAAQEQPQGVPAHTVTPGQISGAKDIAEAVFYLTEASQITGEVLHVDGGAHLGRW